MFRFRKNVTLTAIETRMVRDSFDGPLHPMTYVQRFDLEAAVDAERDWRGVISRRWVGRVVVRHI